jgi:hypothetical protein
LDFEQHMLSKISSRDSYYGPTDRPEKLFWEATRRYFRSSGCDSVSLDKRFATFRRDISSWCITHTALVFFMDLETLKMKATHSFETSIPTYPMMLSHTAGDTSPRLYRCGNFKTHKPLVVHVAEKFSTCNGNRKVIGSTVFSEPPTCSYSKPDGLYPLPWLILCIIIL